MCKAITIEDAVTPARQHSHAVVANGLPPVSARPRSTAPRRR